MLNSMLTNKLFWNPFETSDKFNNIWLKELNSHISKVEGLNWTKILKKD